jgi:hypothetical protein
MTPRTKYLHFWYEVSTTSADPNGSKWQGQLRLGKDLADGRQELILDGHLVPGYFDTEADARDAADAFARVYIDQL